MNIRIGWTQNVVILETDLSMELRDERIVTNAHEMIDLAINQEVLCWGREKSG